MEQQLLELKNVSKVFKIGGGLGIFRAKTITAVDDVSFAMSGDQPAIIALVGESGSGKSTIANMILGLIEPTSGNLTRILLIKPKLLIADEPVSMIDASPRAIFLDDLVQLRDKLKMSCLYITHDLNIAFYVADRMIVLCYGKIVETGPAHAMIERTSHPYTQLLVSSIPIPNPEKRWKDKINVKIESIREQRVERGCIFQLRCSYVMPICRDTQPPMFDVGPEQEAACFLYDKSKRG